MSVKGVRTGVVVSTATEIITRFAQQFVDEAKAIRKNGSKILVNKDDFNRMLDPVLPDRPWFESHQRS